MGCTGSLPFYPLADLVLEIENVWYLGTSCCCLDDAKVDGLSRIEQIYEVTTRRSKRKLTATRYSRTSHVKSDPSSGVANLTIFFSAKFWC